MKDAHEQILFQTDFVLELAKDCNYENGANLDVSQIFFDWKDTKGLSKLIPIIFTKIFLVCLYIGKL